MPLRYIPGGNYPLKVVIRQAGQSRWGFQLTARFKESGIQAGELIPEDGNKKIRPADGIQYISHIEAGTRAGQLNGPVGFSLTWKAPLREGGAVIFNAAGNAANYNDEPGGAYLHGGRIFGTRNNFYRFVPPYGPANRARSSPPIAEHSKYAVIYVYNRTRVGIVDKDCIGSRIENTAETFL